MLKHSIPEELGSFSELIELEFNEETVRLAMAECLWAYSRRTGFEIGPVLDIITSNGAQFVLIDIDGQMTFYCPSQDTALMQYREPQ